LVQTKHAKNQTKFTKTVRKTKYALMQESGLKLLMMFVALLP